ncbi:MAG: hypothetical protein CV090_07845, partial [Nitrospira sp. WS238]|nr:hypothetical protein [Nitrospira sp. WS238]
MIRRSSPRILLLQLEFPTWSQTRAWAYPACFGVAEGLRAAGATCTTIPLFANTPLSPERWLEQAQAVIERTRFDQVWVWLVHSNLTPSVLEWIAGLAQVRVGIVMESLTYDEADYAWAGHLRSRMESVAAQSQVFTHVLVPDERDAEPLAQHGGIRTLWWPTMVPERFIVPAMMEAQFSTAVFHGHPYGPRRTWVESERLRTHMTFMGPDMPLTRYQTWFNQLQTSVLKRFGEPVPMTAQQVADYESMLQEVREAEFTEWMSKLPQWAAIVNLPSLAKFYGGRVYEGMAAGRPILTYPVADRPLNNSLFVEEEEILCFSPDNVDSLYACLDRVLNDRSLSRRIAANAQRKIRRYHTSEKRLAETLRWIESGEQPDYGIGESLEPQGTTLPIARRIDRVEPKTTAFVLTVDDPAFPSCKAALDAQQGTTFKLEIIRNVCPFNAAAQAMIDRCTTPYFIQVDEDMILEPDAVVTMESAMAAAPDDVGMICFHLFDDDRGMPIQGVKIYRTAHMKSLSFRDVKASEMDLLEQMGRQNIQWILHSDVKGRHGTHYTPETMYRRYKTMYEKDIRQWNLLTADIHRKADAFRRTGDPLQLFALLGAAHGIINAPLAADREKDARAYELPELDVFKRLLLGNPPPSQSFIAGRSARPIHQPISFERVCWKSDSNAQERCLRTSAITQSDQSKSLLIVTPFFWPSIGGVERMAEQLGVSLSACGYQVDVATYPVHGRDRDDYRGIRIITLARFDQMEGDLQTCVRQVGTLLQNGHYSACLFLGAPVNSLFYGALTIPLLPKTKLIIQPTMNQEVLDDLKQNKVVYDLFLKLARAAQTVVALSEEGVDACFLREHGVQSVYLPNGSIQAEPRGDFRREYGIAPDRFLILHVANLYSVKNHLGLLAVLNRLPEDVQLVMIGRSTEEGTYVHQVREALDARPDVLYLPGLDAEGIAAAMRAADVLVLASHSEASPLVVLEAMSSCLPWLATPGCGTVHEQAGGLVAPLDKFHDVLMTLKRQPALRRELGALGQAHWTGSFNWSHVVQGWIDLLTTGQLSTTFVLPEEVRKRMQAVRARISLLIPSTDIELNRSSVASAKTRSVQDTSEGAMDSDQFYVNLFVNAPAWSTPHPNADEAARWSKIASFLEFILRRIRHQEPNKVLRILDVGCGRGWLTNLVSMYGTCEGVEPVAEVVAHARRLFPHLRFEAGTADQVLARPDFAPYDVVVTSEVLEHVPHGQKD